MEKLKSDLIALLQEDSRYSPAKLATMLGTSEGDIRRALSEMERDGLIVKYSAVINAEKTGVEFVHALIEVRVTPQQSSGFDAIARQIYNFDNVKSVYLMSGGYDLAVMIEGKTLREVAMFVSERLSTIDGVISTATHFLLKKYKTEGVVLEPNEPVKRIAVQP